MRGRHTALRIGGIILLGLVSLYFIYHAVYGTQGIRRQHELQGEVDARAAELGKLQAERAALEKRTQGLRPESIDPDMLDEQARRQLGYGKDGEAVILTTPK
jgi:cell division protein FtsB